MTSSDALLEVADIGVQFGGIVALAGLDFTIEEESITALIGPNGAGKTTLFNVVSRIYEPSQGQLTWRGSVNLLSVAPHRIAPLGICRTFQNLALVEGLSVLENVMVGSHSQMRRSNFVTTPFRIPPVLGQEKQVRQECLDILERLGLSSVAHRPAAGLPYGTLKRIELARALAAKPQLLMLDEPATGLTHSEVDQLAATIRSLKDDLDLTILLVEHHMGMVMAISDKIVVLDFGEKIAEGTPVEIQENEAVIAAYLGGGS